MHLPLSGCIPMNAAFRYCVFSMFIIYRLMLLPQKCLSLLLYQRSWRSPA